MTGAKSAQALRSIGEVAAETGIPQHVLRYWEGRVAHLRPVKRAGGRRFYRPDDIALVKAIQRLMDQDGYTLDGAAKAVSRQSRGQTINQAQGSPVNESHALIDTLRSVRARLAHALEDNAGHN